MTSTAPPSRASSRPEGVSAGPRLVRAAGGHPRAPFAPDWTNIAFLAAAHLLALCGILYLALVRFSPWTVGLGVLWFACAGFSITGGYHRLFAHRSYRASAPLRAFYLLFGAAAVQNSALKWCADHRLHHAKTDTELDPYNIRRGFLWAHVGWVLARDSGIDRGRVFDLAEDRLVAFQDRHYLAVAIVSGAVLPFLLGFLWRDPWGALLVAGFLRLVVQWHATFFVNSLAHCFGHQPYGTRTSARDSSLVALLTLGEGYHNFHHTFPTDYRNGVRWHHFDPTKWAVWLLSRVGATGNLKRIPKERLRAARAAARARRPRAA